MPDKLKRTLETIPTRDIVRSWRSDFNIDVARLFEGVDEVRLIHDQETDQIWFDPPIVGDEAFYQALRKLPFYHPKTKLEHTWTAQRLKDEDSVLDIGAGDGGFASHIKGANYTGLESDAEAVATAAARGIDIRSLSMAEWRASDRFSPSDMVTAFQVLEHVTDPANFVSDMVSCAATGGCVVIGVPDRDSYVTDLPDFMLNAPPHHVSWWNEAALTRLMVDAGLHIETVKHFPVEAWERHIWWMAQLAKIGRPSSFRYFGQDLFVRKAISFLASWPLQILPIPKTARGSTLLIVGRKL